MIIKILGILDIFVGLCFWLFGILGVVSGNFILILGLFLLIKGIVFATGFSIISFLDIGCGVILMSASNIVIPKIIVIIICLFLFQKGVFSLMS